MYKLSCKQPHLAILILMVSLASIGAALYTPGLPQIATYFHVSNGVAQTTMTTFLIGYALGQLLYGPLSSRFGRKKALHIGIFIAIIGSLFCAASAPLHSINVLIIARFIAAIGSCAGLVVTLTIVHDYYYQEQARRILPYVAASFAIVPGLAVSIGGALVQHLGWQACFYFLALYYVVAFIFVTRLPETATLLEPQATQLRTIFKNYSAAFANVQLLIYATMVAAFAGIIYVYTTNAPLIAHHDFHFTPAQFGLINLIPFIGYLVGNLVNSHLSKFISGRTSILLGGIILTILTLFLWLAYATHTLTPVIFFSLMTLILFNVPFVWSNAAILASADHKDGSSANAVVGFMNVSGAIIGVLFSSIFNHNLLFTTLVTFSIVCIIIFSLYIVASVTCTPRLKEQRSQ